jgi:hypothetical protein
MRGFIGIRKSMGQTRTDAVTQGLSHLHATKQGMVRTNEKPNRLPQLLSKDGFTCWFCIRAEICGHYRLAPRYLAFRRR